MASNTARTYRVGTRRSPLALKQANEVLIALRKFYPAMKITIVGIDTYGDKDKVTPVSEIEGGDFFTREIDSALIESEIDPSTMLRVNGERSRTIDFAIHSAKDLPDKLRKGLSIVAITESIDPCDALVSKNNLSLGQLRPWAKIGTSSSSRKAQLKNYRKDFCIVDIRGNIEERLKLLDSTDLDGIVIAACGLLRLGLGHRISQRIPFDIISPHSLQGALAIVARSEDSNLMRILSVLDSKAAARI